MTQKRTQVEQLTGAQNTIKEKHATLQAALDNSEELLQTLLTGLSSSKDNTTGGGYLGQLADAKARIAQGAAEEEQGRVKLSMAEKDLKGLEARWKDVEREASEGKRQLSTAKANVEKMKQKVAESGWSSEKDEQVERELQTTRNSVRRLREVRAQRCFLCSLLSVYYRNAITSSNACHNLISIIPHHLPILTDLRSKVWSPPWFT